MASSEPASTTIATWVRSHLPADLYAGEVAVEVDRDEVVVIGDVPEADGREPAAAIAAFRERTRAARVEVAATAEDLFGRKVSWGARSGTLERMFTQLGVPVMSRLRFGERELLDTLVEGGVVRSRSEAVGWCVALVRSREQQWLGELRDSLAAVRAARAQMPSPDGPTHEADDPDH